MIDFFLLSAVTLVVVAWVIKRVHFKFDHVRSIQKQAKAQARYLKYCFDHGLKPLERPEETVKRDDGDGLLVAAAFLLGLAL